MSQQVVQTPSSRGHRARLNPKPETAEEKVRYSTKAVISLDLAVGNLKVPAQPAAEATHVGQALLVGHTAWGGYGPTPW